MKRKREDTKFANRLISLMNEKEIRIREAARIAKVSPSTINSWRSGALPENYLAVKRLAEGLGTTFSFLLTGQDDARSANPPTITEVFENGDRLFDGYAKIIIQRLVPRNEKKLNKK